jgi:3-oxoacyl-[acyl-carrier protein] reductase
VIQIAWTSVLEQEPADYQSQFDSCVMHNVYMAKAFVPDMIEKKYGRVIGINTECAMQCNENVSAYAAGKRGMDGIYRVLAKEVGRYNITVNQVAPGWTVGDNLRDDITLWIAEGKDPAGFESGYANEVPLKRQGTDYEIANAVAFLASDLASFITGAYLPVCGGNVMPGI